MATLRRIWRQMLLAAALICVLLFGAVGYYSVTLPTDYYTRGSGLPTVSAALPVAISASKIAPEGRSVKADLLLFGLIPIKEANVTGLSDTLVLPGGEPFGMKLFSDGLMVTGFADIQEKRGKVSCPARDCGLKKGDILLEFNGRRLQGNTDLIEAVKASKGQRVRLTLLRGKKKLQLFAEPALQEKDRTFRLGVLVKDSSAGIGTVTFYEPVTMEFAGLGHPICESDTGMRIPLLQGEAVAAEIESVRKGVPGKAGALQGSFLPGPPLGTLNANLPCGVFGTYSRHLPRKKPVQVAKREQVKKGPAFILTTLHGQTPKLYRAEIEAVRPGDKDKRQLLLRVSDPELIEKAGGIVQGMSGSPILQDGKLVGAVTHVLIGDPKRGYGIFAEELLTALQEEKQAA